MKENISTATLRNWHKLNIDDTSEKLSKRANKSRSQKIILPSTYLFIDNNIDRYIDYLLSLSHTIEDIVYSLCIYRLSLFEMTDKKHVKEFLLEYKHLEYISEIENKDILSLEKDVLGYIYQAITPEGERNKSGKYYTLDNIVASMTEDLNMTKDKFYLDPCCGSGAFLTGIHNVNPNYLYGIDIDPLAVMIAKTNLLIRYRDFIFTPHIFCFDFLKGNTLDTPQKQRDVLSMRFDYIYTNPPWGCDRLGIYISQNISSKERASLFLEKSYNLLKPGGILKFLLPSSILNITTHNDIRQFICENTTIKEIQFYNNKFSGVYTDFFDIKLEKCKPLLTQNYTINKDNLRYNVSFRLEKNKKNTSIPIIAPYESAILSKINQQKNDDLSHSIWGLGIVTGDNKKKLHKEPAPQLEVIYTGKDIMPYVLKQGENYILYDRTQLQQCAKDDLYRAPQKLVYKFISKKLIFAYDAQGRLFLNSANILIPSVDSLSIKSVMAFLNSELYQFTYQVQFNDIKILKGNLMKLSFPKLSIEEDSFLNERVDDVLSGNLSRIKDIDNFIYNLFNISQEEQTYIKNYLYGKANKGIKKTHSSITSKYSK